MNIDKPTISVGILQKSEINIEFIGSYNLGLFSGQITTKIENNKISIYKNNILERCVSEIYFTPIDFDNCSCKIDEVTIGIDFHWEQNETQVFQGDIKLEIVDNKISLINIIPLENYLVSVISSEMSACSSLNLLKTHAIISRSWLLAQVINKDRVKMSTYNSNQWTENKYIRWYDREDHDRFDVCADDHCQRYQGISRANNINVKEAVESTSGIVLMYNGEVCDARFSKCCGGVSEEFETCWQPVHYNYLEMVIDNNKGEKNVDLTVEKNATKWIMKSPSAFCNTTNQNILKQVLNNYDLISENFYRWKVEYTTDEISDLINKKSGIDFGTIIDIVPQERGVSGRIKLLKIVGEKRTVLVGKELEIRKWLSKTHLYSSAFVVEKQESDKSTKFILHGAGWGHGVGLCQIGAAIMGDKGYSFENILMHYFKKSELVKLY